MSALGDIFDFDVFALKDIFKRAGDNPEQLILGAAEPAGAGLWGAITGKDYEPLVNVFGGPMGGDTLGIGGGGVYDRAAEAGIDTGAATKAHDVAEVIAAFYGGQGAMNGLGNAFGGGASGGATSLQGTAPISDGSGGTVGKVPDSAAGLTESRVGGEGVFNLGQNEADLGSLFEELNADKAFQEKADFLGALGNIGMNQRQANAAQSQPAEPVNAGMPVSAESLAAIAPPPPSLLQMVNSTGNAAKFAKQREQQNQQTLQLQNLFG